MNALLRKELRQLQPLSISIAVLVTLGWLLGASAVPIPPSQDLQFVWFLFAVLVGTAVGYFQLGIERSGGTWGLLLQRSLNPARIFVAKVAAGWLTLSLILIAPLLVTWAASLLAESFNVRGRRAMELAALACTSFAAHGLGVLSTTWKLPAQLRGGAALVGMVGLAMLGGAVGLAGWGGFWLRLLGWIGGSAALGATLALLAARNVADGSDSERSPSPLRALALGVTAAVVLVAPFWTVLVAIQAVLVREVYARYGRVVASSSDVWVTEDGTVGTLGNYLWVPEPTGTPSWFDEPADFESPVFHVGERWTALRWSMDFSGPVPSRLMTWFNRATGTLHHVLTTPAVGDQHDRSDGVEDVGSGFSAIVIESGGPWQSSGLLVDEAAGVIFVVNAEHTLERCALPGGDELTSLEWPSNWDARLDWRHAPRFVGESDSYRWTGGSFVPSSESSPLGADAWFGVEYAVEIEGGHTLAPTVRIYDGDGLEVLARDFVPKGLRQQVRRLAVEAIAVLRPPAVVVSSHLRSAAVAGGDGDLLVEQQVYAGHRRDLVVLGFLLAAAFTWHAVKRLQRIGAHPLRTGSWLVAIVALGYAGYIVFRLLEPAPRRVANAAARPVKPLLSDVRHTAGVSTIAS